MVPSTPNYSNWTVETNNNLTNGRGHWTSRISGAQPRAIALFRMTKYLLNGQPQDLSGQGYQVLGTIGADGNYFWGGTVYCPAGMSCDFEWDININVRADDEKPYLSLSGSTYTVAGR